MDPDFSGWATKAGLRCTDGRTIMPEAFKHQDQVRVPLVWQHAHGTPDNVLGHAILHSRPEGVYTHGFFNDTSAGQNAKTLVQHGDVDSLSIYANKLVEKTKQVFHGDIREVSLVLSGANPGAKIDFVAIQHSDGGIEEMDDEAIIYTGLTLTHADGGEDDDESDVEHGDEVSLKEIYDDFDDDQKKVVHYMIGAALEGADIAHAGTAVVPTVSDPDSADDIPEATVEAVYNSLTDQQKNVVHYMIGAALEADTVSDLVDGEATHSDQEGSNMSRRNVFEGSATTQQGPTLSHDQFSTIMEDAKKPGMTLKQSFMAHATEYGIQDLDLLFPYAGTINGAPELVGRRMEWVSKVIDGVRKSPFARIRTFAADITHDEARARGYVKGTLKKDEWLTLTRRVTTPTTIYKKQKLDRDDIIDITDLDIVAWLKAEMRIMLDEEIARAILVGDGRAYDDEDKVDETCIRPIAHDDDFYAHRVILPANTSANSGTDPLVDVILRSRTVYRGTGTPTLFLTEGLLADLLLGRDKMGRRYYNSIDELKVALRVDDLVTSQVMDQANVDGGELLAVMVNLTDYTMGANAGGQVSMFDDFDIDYNQFKYLMETRMSGALTKFKSAIVYARAVGTLVNPTVPSFNDATGVITIPNQDGVVYYNRDTDAPLAAGAQTALDPGAQFTVLAQPADGHYFPSNTVDTWTYTRNNG